MDEKKVSEKKASRGGRRENAGRKAPDGKKAVGLNIRTTPDFRRKLKELAQNEKMSVSDFVRYLVTCYEGRQNQ
jgi:hypothetical protein